MKRVPKEGYSSITIKNKLKTKLEEIAEKRTCTIQDYLEDVADNELKTGGLPVEKASS